MLRNVNSRLLQSEPMQRCRLGECRAACCLHGVWIDSKEAEELLANADSISPYMDEGYQDPANWFDGSRDADEFARSGEVVHSTVVDAPEHYGGTSCIFLRPDHKCALQVASEAAGHHPWYWKPFYCVLHPLDLDEEGQITLDDTNLLLDEPASCLRPADRMIPLIETFEPELKYLAGEQTYQELLEEQSQTNKNSGQA